MRINGFRTYLFLPCLKTSRESQNAALRTSYQLSMCQVVFTKGLRCFVRLIMSTVYWFIGLFPLTVFGIFFPINFFLVNKYFGFFLKVNFKYKKKMR